MGDTRPEFYDAIQQAGRAVAAHLLNIDFSEISLDAKTDSLRDQRNPVLETAGDVALEIHSQGAPVDGHSAPTGTASDQARELLSQGWPAVTAVADLLLTRERVTDEDVRTIVRSTVPEMEQTGAHAHHGHHPASEPRRPSDHGDASPSTEPPRDDAAAGVIDEGGGGGGD